MFFETAADTIDESLPTIQNFLLNNAINLFVSAILIGMGILITQLIKISSKKIIKDNISTRFIFNGLKIIIWVVVFCLIVGLYTNLSKMATALLSGSGVAAVILGLAAQESFSNLFAGFFIALFKPFNKNDLIRIDGMNEAGYVEDINLRHTVMRTYNNMRLIIPNSVISSSKLQNFSYVQGIIAPIEVEIAYENRDKRYRAMEIMEETVSGHPLFFDMRSEEDKQKGVKAAECQCTAFDGSGIKLGIRMRTLTYEGNLQACSECRMRILDRFEEEGIEIPYNKMVIYDRTEGKEEIADD